ncbi:hypothetical protein SLA2020_436420 [Shorea laevis]
MNCTTRTMLILASACVFACYLAWSHEIPPGKHQLLIQGKESDEKLPTTFLRKFNKAGTVFLLLIGATLTLIRHTEAWLELGNFYALILLYSLWPAFAETFSSFGRCSCSTDLRKGLSTHFMAAYWVGIMGLLCYILLRGASYRKAAMACGIFSLIFLVIVAGTWSLILN